MTSEASGAMRLAGAIDAVTRFAGKAIAWLILPMVGSLVWEVVAHAAATQPTVGRAAKQLQPARSGRQQGERHTARRARRRNIGSCLPTVRAILQKGSSSLEKTCWESAYRRARRQNISIPTGRAASLKSKSGAWRGG